MTDGDNRRVAHHLTGEHEGIGVAENLVDMTACESRFMREERCYVSLSQYFVAIDQIFRNTNTSCSPGKMVGDRRFRHRSWPPLSG